MTFSGSGLEDPVDEPGYREEDWNSLEQMLDGQRKRRGMVFWLPILGSAAALLLLFLGWWSFRVKTVDHPQAYCRTCIPLKKNKDIPGVRAAGPYPGKLRSQNQIRPFLLAMLQLPLLGAQSSGN